MRQSASWSRIWRSQRARIARIFDEVLVPPAALTPGAPVVRPWNLSLGLAVVGVAGGARSAAGAAAGSRRPANIRSERAAALRVSGRRAVGARTARAARRAHSQRRRAADPDRAAGILCPRRAPSRRLSAPARAVAAAAGSGARVAATHGCCRAPGGRACSRCWPRRAGPASARLDSDEYQCVEAWRELLAGLSHLDLILGPVAFDTALETVGRLAAERLFQPETPPVPVQVMGVLESTALEFDHLFVLGLHAEVWPRPARPNPLLPIELQRRVSAPGSGPEWELGFAQRMTEGWRRAAPQIVFCWPAAEGDRMLAPSPLLSGLPAAQPEQIGSGAVADPTVGCLQDAGRLESLVDVSARPLESGRGVRRRRAPDPGPGGLPVPRVRCPPTWCHGTGRAARGLGRARARQRAARGGGVPVGSAAQQRAARSPDGRGA